MLGMVGTLLATKLFMPPVPREWVTRPRLIDELRSGVQVRLTLVSAPAGYGKTALLSEGLRTTQVPTGWLSLDESDNDLTLFWEYFIAALKTVHPEIGDPALALVRASQPLSVGSVLASLINDVAKLSTDFALVLDDYHVIENDSIHEALCHLVDRMPPRMHLFVATRADPPLPLARLRASGYMTELRAADLRFTGDEVVAFLNEVMMLGLTRGSISALETRTEGWIAGLRMAALSMRGRDDVSPFLESFGGGNRYIFDYLVEEVLNRQCPQVREFLLCTSILDRLTGLLCDAVTEGGNGWETLERLEAANLFVVPLDSNRIWYRYHQLFSELLRAQLARERPASVSQLHSRASGWFEKEGLTSEAVQHAIESQDFDRAADIIEPAALRMIAQNRGATVSAWLSKLPDELLTHRPWLCAAGAWASLAMRQLDAVEAFLRRVAARLPGTNAPEEAITDERRLRSHLLTIRAFLARGGGNLPGAIALSHQALECVADDDLIVLSTLTLNLGIAYWMTGDLESGRRYVEVASEKARAGGNYYIALTAMSFLAEIEFQMGHLQKAADIYRRAIELGTEWGGGEPLPASGYAFVGLSRVLYEWNHLADAEAFLSRGIQLGKLSAETDLLLRGYLALAWLKQAQGEAKAAREAFKKAHEVRPLFAYLGGHISSWETRSWLAQGGLAEASTWAAEQERKLKLSDTPDCASEAPYLTLLRVKIAIGEIGEIPALLDPLLATMEEKKRISGLIEVRLLKALALQAQDKLEEAIAELEQALSLAEPEGYVRIFVDEGEPMARLLRHAAARGIRFEYVTRLLTAFGEAESISKASAEQALEEPLTQRELEVLRLIASGLSNREAAEELVVTVGTVKRHLNNIFGKLQAKSRTHAVAKAKELKLL